jgi:ABC-type multidrug transport system fused ATPase/permease subunit
MLPRFYDPTSGSMTLDGIDAKAVRVRDLRKHVALVLQESVILPTTVAENIAYGRPEATLDEVKQAATLAGAATFIEKMEHGYDTIISESGGNLSGGQKQRISIARALCTKAPIIVLDEPTSALDPQHEAMIVSTLRDMKRQRTIVLVSHRLSTVADCDRIYVMSDGRVVEEGTHDELIARRGHYFEMAKHQMRLE